MTKLLSCNITNSRKYPRIMTIMSFNNGLVLKGVALIMVSLLSTSFTHTASAEDMGFTIWEVDNEQECRARITFLGSKEFLFESGEQVATKSYKIKPFGKKGFHKLHMRTTSHNGKPNCAGTIGVNVGDRQDTFIKFSQEQDEMTFYSAPKPDASFDITFKKKDIPEG